MDKKNIENIIALLKRGDVSILEAIYKENRIAFLNFARKFNISDYELIDVYQDAIIAFHDNIVNGKIVTLNSSIRTYLFSIGKFMIYKKMKMNRRTEYLDDALMESIEDFDFLDNSQGIKDQEQQQINACFKKLGIKCQQVLSLFYYNGLSLKEIQEYLGYESYNVIKSQKSRCLKTLKDMINTQN